MKITVTDPQEPLDFKHIKIEIVLTSEDEVRDLYWRCRLEHEDVIKLAKGFKGQWVGHPRTNTTGVLFGELANITHMRGLRL